MADTTDIVVLRDGIPTTDTLIIAEGADVEHKSVIQLVRTYLSDLEEFGGVTFEMRPFETAGGTQTREVAILNEEQSTLIFTYMRNTAIVRTFKKRLVKKFFEYHRGSAPAALPDRRQLALMVIAEADRADKAEAERDEAIRTKALIGSKREATAMATAAKHKIRADKLEAQLDKSAEFASVKRMESAYGRKFHWVPLRRWSKDHAVPSVDIPDANYGIVKGWHCEAWRAVYGVDVPKVGGVQ